MAGMQWVSKGMQEYIAMLGNLAISAPQAMGKAIYEGADIVADEIMKNLKGLKTDDRPFPEQVQGPKTVQKEGLINSLGIASARTDGTYRNVKIGFDGYNKLGQPNAMIARTFEGGNSFTKKQPFVAPAIRNSRLRAESHMEYIIDQETKKIFNK